MSTNKPGIYLLSPPSLELETFKTKLAKVLDGYPVACFRLGLLETDEQLIAKAADQLREICHERDIPIVINTHWRLVEKLGLDGVHLPDGPKHILEIRKALGKESIIGCHCKDSRHDGMIAAERGADYISFGPVFESNLGAGDSASPDLFKWWSEMIEVPSIAEGILSKDDVIKIDPYADFITYELSNSINSNDILKQLKQYFN